REEAEQRIDAAQARAEAWLDGGHLRDAFRSLSSVPGSQGWLEVERATTIHVLASDDFVARMKQYAAKRPSEEDLKPLRDRWEQTLRRRQAMHAELKLRKLDEQRDQEEAQRATALDALG